MAKLGKVTCSKPALMQSATPDPDRDEVSVLFAPAEVRNGVGDPEDKVESLSFDLRVPVTGVSGKMVFVVDLRGGFAISPGSWASIMLSSGGRRVIVTSDEQSDEAYARLAVPVRENRTILVSMLLLSQRNRAKDGSEALVQVDSIDCSIAPAPK